MDIQEQLRSSGLHKQETEVYLYLLAQDQAAPPQIAAGTKILRANTYNVLRSLQDKGLIERHKSGKRFVYTAKDPTAILRRVDEQREALSTALPDLRALYKSQKNKPSVRFYYGMDEIKEMFGRTEDAEEILYIATSDTLFEKYPTFFKQYRESLVQEQVMIRDILTQQSGIEIARKTKSVMRGYYDARFLPRTHADIPSSIRIWNDNVGLVTFEEPATGTVMTNPALAKTFKTMFEVMWSASDQLS